MVDSNYMLFGVPKCDTATSTLYYHFVNYYIPYAQNKGLWTIQTFTESACNQDNIHNALQTHQHKGVLQGAHGGKWTMGGQAPDGTCSHMTWWASLDNCADAEGKIIYFIACNCGQYLGPVLVSQWGASAWAGYDDLCYTSSAQRYRDCLGEFWLALCDGDTVGEAFARAISKYNYWINIYPYANLIWNRDHFMMVGNTTDTLLPGNPIINDSVQFTIQVQ